MKLLSLLSFLILVSCEKTEFNKLNADRIYGNVSTFFVQKGGLSAIASIRKLSCSNVGVFLYRLKVDGSIEKPALSTTSLERDGSFVLSGLRSKIDFENDQFKTSYLIEAEGCEESYSRIVTGYKEQNVSFGSSLISFISIQKKKKDWGILIVALKI